jgi:hypothetical protein
MMKCEELDHYLIDYIDGRLDETLHEGIRQHLLSCERCRDEARSLEVILHSISARKDEGPDQSLSSNFYHMLQTEKEKQKPRRESPDRNFSTFLFYRMAAGFLLLLAGSFIAYLIHQSYVGPSSSSLGKEYKIGLSHDSPGERIKAVSFIDNCTLPDDAMLQALIEVLNNDDNVNVRLAAAYSLSNFSDYPLVRDSIVSSLGRQTEPVVQIVLINMLTEMMEPKAVQPIENILSDKSTIEQVKNTAEKSISILL